MKLVSDAGFFVSHQLVFNKLKPDYKTFIGSGQLDQVKDAVLVSSKNTPVFFSTNISATQKRNIEKTLCCEVLDRTELILYIFSQRAKSY